MKFLNPTYLQTLTRKIPLTLYLTITLVGVSVFSRSSPHFGAKAYISNNRVFSDSLKEKPPVAGPDTPQVLNTGSIVKTNLDSLHAKDSTTASVRDTSIHKKDTVALAEDSEIKDIINYKATDSIVYNMETKQMLLYNTVDIKYQKIKLNANVVNFDWTTYTLTAHGTADSVGRPAGTPVFSEDGKEFKADSMKYNFKTTRGLVYHVVTKEGDAFIHSNAVKKNVDESWFGKESEYTTCDLDEPHFYFKAKKVKIIPDKVMISGPANLWIGGVPTPLYVPFAIFPVKQGQRSGIVLPEYGQDATLGFFLRNGGYYWSINDYINAKLTGQISTNGTWGLTLAQQYALRYTFTGNYSFSVIRTAPTDPDQPGAKASNAYSFQWSHVEDPRSLSNSTFGANVQMQSSDFYQASRITDTRLLTTTFSSSIDYSHAFVGTPFSLQLTARHDQNLANGTIDFTVPTLRLSMSHITPFKGKIKSEKPKWYENIGLAYSFEIQNRLSTYDSTLFQQSSLNKITLGADQNISIDAPFKVFKYFTLTPQFAYQERTYFKGNSESWDPDTVYTADANRRTGLDTINGRIKSDTTWHFNSAHDFSASLTFGTKVTGIYKFKGKYIKALKHVFTPSISANYHPDFGSNFWGYYRNVQNRANGTTTRYSVFDPGAIYGIPTPGKQGALLWNLGNNFELKTYSKKDSVTHEKKIGLLDQVNLSGGYNFAADSLRLLPFNLTVVASRLFNFININFNAIFDPYATDSNNRDINVYEWQKAHKLLRFATANAGLSFSLHSKPKPVPPGNDQAPPKFIGDYVSYSPDQIYNFDIPWNLSGGYNFNITHGTYLKPDTIIVVQSINLKLDFNITAHWKVAVSTGFDVVHRQITLTNLTVARDLHCWELTFNWTPALPTFNSQQFSIILQPKSPTLKDLKAQKKNSLQPL